MDIIKEELLPFIPKKYHLSVLLFSTSIIVFWFSVNFFVNGMEPFTLKRFEIKYQQIDAETQYLELKEQSKTDPNSLNQMRLKQLEKKISEYGNEQTFCLNRTKYYYAWGFTLFIIGAVILIISIYITLNVLRKPKPVVSKK